jgi:hypothetical protein
LRMVETKAGARRSAARLLANPPGIPRMREEVSPRTCSIGPSWQGFDARRSAKNVSKSGSSGQEQVNRARLIRAPPTSEGPPGNFAIPDGPLTCRYIRGQVNRSTATGEKRGSGCIPSSPGALGV